MQPSVGTLTLNRHAGVSRFQQASGSWRGVGLEDKHWFALAD